MGVLVIVCCVAAAFCSLLLACYPEEFSDRSRWFPTRKEQRVVTFVIALILVVLLICYVVEFGGLK